MNGSIPLGTDQTLQLDNTIVSPNDTITCTTTAVDAQGSTIESTASTIVENSDPVIDPIVITPEVDIYVARRLLVQRLAPIRMMKV